MLGHEIIHVTEQHTIHAIQKSKTIQMGADETLSGNAALFNSLVDNVYLTSSTTASGAAKRTRATKRASRSRTSLGYAPQGLSAFLTRLQERNKDANEKRGLFASHPGMKERLDRLAKQITRRSWPGKATVADRYSKNISYKPVPQPASRSSKPVRRDSPAAAPQGRREAGCQERREEEKSKSRRRSAALAPRTHDAGRWRREKKSAQVSAAQSARGVDPESDAKGGSNPKPVPVNDHGGRYRGVQERRRR